MHTRNRALFYFEMFQLQASYLHHRLRREPWWGMDYAFGNFCQFKAICKHAPGMRMDLDDHAWRALLADCWAALMRNFTPGGRQDFVEYLYSVWGPRWDRAYPIFEAHQNAERYIGCFRYDIHPADHSVNLHFHNTVQPASPFGTPGARIADLQAIVAEIEAAGHRPQTVHFQSWMNALRPVQALFPASFAANLVASEEFPKGYGWWGQFITKEGGIHAPRGELLKRDGRFEFVRLNGHCSWADFRTHVLNATP